MALSNKKGSSSQILDVLLEMNDLVQNLAVNNFADVFTQIRQEKADLKKQQDDSDAARQQAEKTLASLKDAQVQNQAQIDQLTKVKADADSVMAQNTAAANDLANQQNQLAADRKAFQAKMAAANADLDIKAKAYADIQARAQAAKDAQDAADAMKADYEQKLAALKQLAG